jgi:hypothetical protein
MPAGTYVRRIGNLSNHPVRQARAMTSGRLGRRQIVGNLCRGRRETRILPSGAGEVAEGRRGQALTAHADMTPPPCGHLPNSVGEEKKAVVHGFCPIGTCTGGNCANCPISPRSSNPHYGAKEFPVAATSADAMLYRDPARRLAKPAAEIAGIAEIGASPQGCIPKPAAVGNTANTANAGNCRRPGRRRLFVGYEAVSIGFCIVGSRSR